MPDESRTRHGGRTAITGTTRVEVERIESMQASAKDLLITDLKILRQESGQPSLNELARLSQGKFSKNAIDDHLSGRRTGIPNWRIMSAYIHACHEFARSTGLSIERLGTMEEWRVRWQAANAGDRAAVIPVRDSNSSSTYTAMDVKAGPVLDGLGPTIAVSRSANYIDTTAGIIAMRDGLDIDVQSLKKALPTNAGILIVTNGPIIGARFEVSGELVTIGRDPESDIVLNDPTVSRRHAVIHRYGTTFTVRDVGSRNGTYLHQIKLITESPLPSNEELQIGIFRMCFLQGARAQDLGPHCRY